MAFCEDRVHAGIRNDATASAIAFRPRLDIPTLVLVKVHSSRIRCVNLGRE